MRSYLSVFLLALVLGVVLTPVAARIGRRIGALDRHNFVPRAGGLAVVAAAALALGILALVFLPPRALLAYSGGELKAVYLGSLAIFALGLVDDSKGLKAAPKFAIEILIAAALWAAGVRAATVWLPFGIVSLGQIGGLLFTIVWIVGITNAFNLLDGIDGAAAGAAVFALLAMFVASANLDQPLVALLTVALAGATLGFLPHNFPPARVYLGDSGALFLGFMLATLAIEGASKGPAIVAIAIPMVAFAVPVLDTLIAVVRRAARGAPLFKGDREHLHHRLLDLGLTNAQAAAVLYIASAGFALASMLFLNPNVRGMAVVMTMIAAAVWLSVRHLRLHEFFELGRLAQRGITQTRAISFNVQIRRAADQLERVTTWDEIVSIMAGVFAESEFDGVRIILETPGKSNRREFQLDGGGVVEEKVRIQPDEWGVHLPFQVGPAGSVQGELAMFRRLGRSPLLTDVNIVVEVLRPALNKAAARVAPPA